MCGIIGGINIPVSAEDVQRIRHRGPDSDGRMYWTHGKSEVYFGHTRLAIQDLSPAGAQPMCSPCGRYALIFNGEIYNHLDLRARISGVQWNGHSDTETILHHLIRHGIGGVRDFNGIFAFAFYDMVAGKVHLARDPYGVKPLYYHLHGNKLAWSSELRGVRGLVPESELNLNALYQFLKLRYVPSPETMWKGILKLEPGNQLSFDLATGRTQKEFYSYRPNVTHHILESDALICLDELVNQAVERQLLADVPVALLLSGGVDSGLLAHLAQEHSGGQIATFTAGFDLETDANELEEARETARILGTKHHEVILKPEDFFTNFEKFIQVVEEPNGSSSIFPIYFLSQAIHDAGYKVALTGQGVDEPWNGYARYNLQNMMDGFPKELSGMLGFMQKFNLGDKVRRGLNAVMESDRIRRFIESYSLFDENMLNGLAPGVFSEANSNALYGRLAGRYQLYNLEDQSAVKAMSSMDLRMNLSDDLLLYTDKISMWHALELRVPFLDTQLTEFVEALPDKYKLDLFKNKILHKKLAEKYLPSQIINRKKKGFYTPQKEMFRSEHSFRIENEMLDSGSQFNDLFNEPYIRSLFQEHRSGRINHEKQLYLLTVLHYWFKAEMAGSGSLVSGVECTW